ncbi:hypothetical protein TSAR_012864 [Trichomalopsis sarcophagae]|uniref:BRISC complex subunit FAM175B helical domain-containing protein n=1 Tax=Trichomalopsis sarcophagae TaxID=543379 RepID=A0A232FCW2_9HYME|nr:hypothetical protein TSAR_012864 [Trichomalopsis sarcophagae]
MLPPPHSESKNHKNTNDQILKFVYPSLGWHYCAYSSSPRIPSKQHIGVAATSSSVPHPVVSAAFKSKCQLHISGNMADDGDDGLLVTISGAAFSMLLFENTRIHDQIGFLLGETLVYVSTKVTDSDNDVQHRKLHINIKNVVSYPLGEPFFNGLGQIKKDKLTALLGQKLKNVVGWYHFRQEFRLATSLRDKNIHNDLSTLVSSINPLMEKESFTLCLLSSSVNETGGTHRFKHQLLRKQNKIFKPVPLKITNLGADATDPDGSDYKPTPRCFSNDLDAFDIVYDSIKNELSNLSGVKAVTLIERAAENLLEKLSPQVSSSDKEVSELETRVALLRNQIFKAQFEGAKNNFTTLEEQMQKMEVDSNSYARPLLKSPSPEIMDSPMSPMLSTSATTIQSPKITHDGSGDRSSRDRGSSDRELPSSNLTPLSSPGDGSRLQESEKSPKESAASASNTSECNHPTRTRQTTDQFIQNTTTRSTTQHRGLCPSPKYNPDS